MTAWRTDSAPAARALALALVSVTCALACRTRVVSSGDFLCDADSDCRWGWVCQRSVGQNARCVSQASAEARACPGKAPLCALKQGVCVDAVQACGGTLGWLACDALDYRVQAEQRGLTYEAEELSCDGRDNDCDGLTDEAAACCKPSCEQKACGADDGCGGRCVQGACPDNASCAQGRCECLGDACGQACCASGQSCHAGSCCTPQCGERACGPDPACGAPCGYCDRAAYCSAEGTCGGSWAVHLGGAGSDAGRSIIVANERLYLAGGLAQKVAFAGGEVDFGEATQAFIGYVDPADRQAHLLVAGSGSGNDKVEEVALHPSGDLVACGIFEESLALGPFHATSKGSLDLFVARIRPSGDVLWLATAGGAGRDFCSDLGIGPAGEIFITGSFAETSSFGGTTLVSQGKRDVFVARLAPSDGAFELAKTVLAGPEEDMGWSLVVGPKGHPHVAGTFSGSARAGNTTLTSAGGLDAYIGKLDPQGEPLWIMRGGSKANDELHEVSVDQAEQVFGVGTVQGAGELAGMEFWTEGKSDVLALRLGPAGKPSWVRTYGGKDLDVGFNLVPFDTGELLISGHFQGKFLENEGFASRGEHDLFVAKINARGELTWAFTFGGPGNDLSQGLARDARGNAYLIGTFPLGPFSARALVPRGLEDVFVYSFGSTR